MPEVSFIIPNYNGKELLNKYLPSLIREIDAQNSEIIVVDDCSTDASAEFIRNTFPAVRLLGLKKNQGFAEACNLGVKQAKHHLVCILNTDVEILPGFLKPLLTHFSRQDTFVVSSMQVPADNALARHGLPALEFKFGIFWYKYQSIYGVPPGAVSILFSQGAASVYDKKKFLELGGFDTLYRPFYWEDLDICYRAWKKGWQSIYEPASTHRHYGQATISKKHRRLARLIFHWKNRFLFTWSNIKSPVLWTQHVLFLPFELFILPLLQRPEFTLGFFYALKQVPDVIVRRLKDKTEEKMVDEDIMKKFSPARIRSQTPAGILNILYLHETALISGAENSLLNLVKKLDRTKFTPYFVLPEEGPLAVEVKSLNVPVELVAFPKVRCGRGVFKTARRLIELVWEKRVHIIHSNSIRTHIYGSIAAKNCGIFSVWHQRNLLQKEIIDPDRLFFFLADRIICNSAAIARRFQVRGRMPEKVYVVLNGVDTLAFNPSINGAKIREEFAIQPDEIVVGIASRFNLQKGHETFLEAAAIILSCQPNLRNKIRFLIAGGAVFQSDKKREQYLLSVAEKMGISDRVIFTGFRKDMPQVYAAMDMFVLASDAEACGRVILEAMASGKAVIATNSGGTPEIVKDKETGFLIEPRNPKDLADKIAFLVNNIAVARKTGEAGRKIVEENFSIEKNVREIEKIYLELIFR